MKNVTILPSAKAREALSILEHAYAYYTPEPIRLPVADVAPGVLIPYYSAA
ncbi:hypothetical protein QO034_09760 [Sedimentitalea sp. JM2-8]|uniref:Uncharacterized protein n=1 Tax=Sedimentitalea xiamensis TaxID=3050037 RepID=A0ABT7FEA5_9RHOB|nr:hypothetical protein [Sedimentitalea xiamensis]MDK3073395.1 hypothetical protein [Sedimentitalea xiamensis]